jgi:chemotaxis methyl-accepting protein methylase
LRVWSAGCACGEEVYSLKIVWEQMRLSGSILPEIEINETDLNPQTLQRAKEGKYPRSSLKQVSKRRRESCFRVKRGGRQYWINESLKSGIRWLVLDLFAPPPETGFHLIFIRNNLLTYFQAERILPALDQILESLAAGGYLVIGSHERLPYEKPALQLSATLPYVFQKKAGNQPIH